MHWSCVTLSSLNTWHWCSNIHCHPCRSPNRAPFRSLVHLTCGTCYRHFHNSMPGGKTELKEKEGKKMFSLSGSFVRFVHFVPHQSQVAHWLCTRSWALHLALPQVNSTSPALSAEVCVRVNLWTAPIFSTRTSELGCRASPFKLHTGDMHTGAESSHSKQALSGAETSTSSSSLTTDRDSAAPGEKRCQTTLQMLWMMIFKIYFLYICPLYLRHFLFKRILFSTWVKTLENARGVEIWSTCVYVPVDGATEFSVVIPMIPRFTCYYEAVACRQGLQDLHWRPKYIWG